MARRIRDVISLLCIVACVALVVVWIRSYKAADRLHGKFWGRHSFVVASKQGRVTLVGHRWDRAPETWCWEIISFSASDEQSFSIAERSFPIGSIRRYESILGFGVVSRPLILGPPFGPENLPRPVEVEYVQGLDIIVLRGRGLTQLNGAGVIVPYWFLVLVVAATAAGLQMRQHWRFSLRALLMTFAFVAVLMGLITTLDRAPISNDDVPPNSSDAIDLIRGMDNRPEPSMPDIPAQLDEL
jgi:hypothetical protein